MPKHHKEQFIELAEIDITLSNFTDSDTDISTNTSFTTSPYKSETKPILPAARSRSSSHASYFTFDDSLGMMSPRSALTPMSQSGGVGVAMKMAHVSKSPQKLWHSMERALKIEVLSYLDVESLMPLRLLSHEFSKLLRVVPVALNDGVIPQSSTQMQRFVKMSLNIAKMRIKSPSDYRFMEQHYDVLRHTLRHVVIWLRKDQYTEVKANITNFLEGCMVLETLEFRHFYNDALLQSLKRIPTLKRLHLLVQQEGIISKIAQEVPLLNIEMDVDWCSWQEVFELRRLKRLERVSLACFEELRALQLKDTTEQHRWMDPIFTVTEVRGKCFSEMHLLFMFHHFPNARDNMEYCGEAPDSSALDATLSTDEAIQALWEKMTSMAEELQLPKETLRRLDQVFDRILSDDLSVWNTFVTIIDLYAHLG